MNSQDNSSNTLLVLLLIFIGLAFVYPLFANNQNLGELAVLVGFFGGLSTFCCILTKAMAAGKCNCEKESEAEDSDLLA